MRFFVAASNQSILSLWHGTFSVQRGVRRMCTSWIFKRALVTAMIAAGCVISARSQMPAAPDQTSNLVELLNNIKNAVQGGHYTNPTDAYKTVSSRLTMCAMTYGLLSKNSKTEQSERHMFEAASSLYSRAAAALYPGGPEEYRSVLKRSRDELIRLRLKSDEKGMFYLLRNCADFSKAGSVEGAVRELFL